MISSPIKAFEVRDDSVSIRFSCKNYGKHLRIAIDNLCDTIKGGNPENKGHRDRYIGSLFRVDGPVPMILKSFFTKYFGFANDKFND